MTPCILKLSSKAAIEQACVWIDEKAASLRALYFIPDQTKFKGLTGAERAAELERQGKEWKASLPPAEQAAVEQSVAVRMAFLRMAGLAVIVGGVLFVGYCSANMSDSDKIRRADQERACRELSAGKVTDATVDACAARE